VCDIRTERAAGVAAQHTCNSYCDFDELLKDTNIDVISLCTPNGMHADMAIKAMDAGKHVLCEKPMALSVIEAEKMVEANLHSGRSFFLVKQNRYNPPIVALKEAFRKNQLGNVYLINATVYWNRNRAYFEDSDWKGTKELDGGALFTQASHFLDLMLYLGGRVKSVYAVMGNVSHPYIETEDLGLVIIKFENGALGTLQYTVSVYEKNFEGTIGVLGTKGTVKIGGKYINDLEYWNVAGVPKPELEAGAPPNDYGSYQGSMSNHDKVYKNVTDVLLHNGRISTTSLQGKESVEIMQAAYISAIQKREVNLPLQGADRTFDIRKQ
jgi:predicted dehydrogenase